MFSPLRGGADHRVPTNYSINFTEGKHDSEDKTMEDALADLLSVTFKNSALVRSVVVARRMMKTQ
jgi:hypothetical protein